MKRILGCLLALCILYCGCADKIAEPAPGGQAGTETEIISTEPAQTPNAALEIREDTILQGGEYASGTPGQHVILVSGARLSGVGLTLDKSGDGSAAGEDGVLTGAENAALLAENGAYAEVSGSAISSGAAGGHAVAVTDGSALLADTMIVTTGSGAAALYVSGGSAELRRSELVSGSGSASALYVTASGSVTAEDSQITSDAGDTAALYGGTLTLIRCTLTGDLRIHGTGNRLAASGSTLSGNVWFPEAEDEAALSFTDGSTFTGAIVGDGAIGISVSLSQDSRWTLTEDCYVAGFADADAALSNIESNGHSIYYNAELEANAVWMGKSYALPGGGYLIPLI